MVKKSVLARNIRKIRSFKNLNQTDFAEAIGVNRPALAAYEEGRAEPKLATLVRLSRFAKLSLDQLVTQELTVNQIAGFDYDQAHILGQPAPEALNQIVKLLSELKHELAEVKKNQSGQTGKKVKPKN